MDEPAQDVTRKPVHRQSGRLSQYLFHTVLLIMFVLPLVVGFSIMNEHRQSNAQGNNTMNALVIFTEDVTLYHVWLEEYLTHPTKQNRALFDTHIQRAEAELPKLEQLAKRYGGALSKEPLSTATLRQHFQRLIVIGDRRVSHPALSGTDSADDNVFDAQFNAMMLAAHTLRKGLNVRLSADADQLVEDSHRLLTIEALVMLLTWGGLILITRRRQALVDRALERESEQRAMLEDDLAQKDLIIRQKDKLRLHIEQTPMGVIEWTPEFEVVRWNPAAEKIFGYTAEEAIGHRAEELILNESQFAELADFIKTLVGQAGGYRNVNHNVTKNGNIILCDWHNTPLIDHDGNTVGVASLVMDITEKTQMEEAHRRLVTMLENTSDLVAIANPDGGLTYLNAAGRRMLGVAADEALDALNIGDFHSGEDMEYMRHNVFPRTAEAPVQEDMILVNRQGEEIPVSTVVMQDADEDGNVRHYMASARDLREEKRAQARLEHSQRLESLGVLAGGIAHDFNNILTAILGNAALANNKLNAASPLRKYLQNIEDGSQRAADLCKQMLAYSGKGRFVVEAIDLNQSVDNIVQLLQVSIHKNVVLKYQLQENLPMVDADASQIQQVIMNLVINASEAIEGKSGIISIGTGIMSVDDAYLQMATSDMEVVKPGRYVYLEVSDTGCGMDKKTRKKVFDPFFTTKFTGRGLGMSAILGIVRGHKGAIKCYSEKKRGTTFNLC